MRKILLVLAAMPCVAFADDVFIYQSQTGNYAGQGMSQTLTYPAGTLHIQNYGNGLNIGSPNSATPNWSLLINPPTAMSSLTAACYERAVDSNFSSPQQPELNFGLAGRGADSGRFKILELVPGASGQPPSAIAIDFVVQDPDGGPALMGKIRINSAVPTSEAFLTPGTTLTGSLNYNAQAGAIGAGGSATSRTIAFDATTLTATRNYNNGVSMIFTGPVTGLGSNVFWDLDFAAADSAPLTVGSYLNAQRYPFQPAGIPGLNFAFNGSGCNTVAGDFTVSTATYDSIGGNPLHFHTDFNQHCNSASNPLTIGTIDYTATIINAPVDPDLIFTNSFSGVVFNTVWNCP
jgi:hypothetical protein